MSADFHGVITSLSQLKISRGDGNQNYVGEVYDETQTLRFVGFSQVQKKHLDDFLTMKWPV